MERIRCGLAAMPDWRIAWVPRRCNSFAHKLAAWAAASDSVGFFSLFNLPEHIRTL